MLPRESSRAWQLPDGIDELPPAAAAHLESLRRRLLGCAGRWGYQLVIPPLAEFTESLLVGVGEDLDLLTFKVPDQLSGRMLGIRADITPQVARMDAHSLRHRAVNRLCYAGSTLHTRARSLLASRSPLQLGAELYGDASAAADLEVIDLLLSLLGTAGLDTAQLTLDLGHGALFTHLLRACEIDDPALRRSLFDALQRKSRPDLDALLADLPDEAAGMLSLLLDLHGDLGVLERALTAFGERMPALRPLLEELDGLAAAIGKRHPRLSIYIDLGELRGYHYHTGAVFAVYGEGLGEALAYGGRYDNVGAVYGRARPATGFAMDLRLLAALLPPAGDERDAVAAPATGDPQLLARIAALREAGETVIQVLGGEPDPRCGRQLVCENDQWELRPLAERQ
jgi:ATP phosphoribosyltransferase regulatory subunit